VISTGVGETLFFFKREIGREPLQSRNGDILDLAVGGEVGRSDIGSVSQPLDAPKACFK